MKSSVSEDIKGSDFASYAQAINFLAAECRMCEVARQATRGGWAEEASTMQVAKMHAELSAAFEGLHDRAASGSNGLPITALEEHMANLVIMAMSFSVRHRLNLGRAILVKHNHNIAHP